MHITSLQAHILRGEVGEPLRRAVMRLVLLVCIAPAIAATGLRYVLLAAGRDPRQYLHKHACELLLPHGCLGLKAVLPRRTHLSPSQTTENQHAMQRDIARNEDDGSREDYRLLEGCGVALQRRIPQRSPQEETIELFSGVCNLLLQ